MTKRTKILSLAAALMISLLAVAPASQAAQAGKDWPKGIALAGGRPGGGVYTVATGMASLLTKYIGIKSAAGSGLFGKNLVLLHKGDGL